MTTVLAYSLGLATTQQPPFYFVCSDDSDYTLTHPPPWGTLHAHFALPGHTHTSHFLTGFRLMSVTVVLWWLRDRFSSLSHTYALTLVHIRL